jgi:hypothetical protein
MRKISAQEIALSALSAALATVFLTLGTITPVLLFTAYLVACISLMLPLSRGSYLGYLFAYAVTGLLTLLFCGAGFIFDLLPFLLFFGLHPLVNELQLKFRWKKWIAFALKAAWFEGAMYIAWRFTFDMTTAIALPHEVVILLLVLVGTAFFYFYDYTTFKCRANVNLLVNRLLRKK